MGVTSLEFRGVDASGLLAGLGLAISVALFGYGLAQVLGGRRRRGLAAGAGGLLGAGLVLWAAVRVPMSSPPQRVLWMVLLGSVVALAVGTFYSAAYAYLGRRRMLVLLALRFLAILALLLMLFKPALSLSPQARDRRLALPVLVDRSASMDTVDAPDLPSRYRQAVEALAVECDRLRREFRISWRHFASDVQAVDDVDGYLDLAPRGEGTDATNLALALRRAVGGYAPDELAGVLLLSDGLHNTPSDPLEAAGESPVPVYVIGIGSETPSAGGQRNVRLTGVDAPLEAVRDNLSTLTAQVRLTGWANIPAKVTLSEDGRLADAQQVITESNAQTRAVPLKWTPRDLPRPGATGPAPAGDVRRLVVSVEPNPAETTSDDNAAEVHVLVTQPRIRVLYVEGTLRPEYKFLRLALEQDPNVQCASLVRLAENRFLSQGAVDDHRLTALPAPEELARFDVVILGDLDSRYLPAALMEQVRQSVHDGKGLLMIGGQRSFGPGGYAGTPVEAALPVVMGDRSMRQETARFVPQLTADGLASPIFAGLEKFFDSPAGRAAQPVPELLGCVTVASVRPGATVLAVHPKAAGPDGPLVVLAVQQYGAGRSCAFAGDTTWQWYMRLQGLGADSPYHRFWGQLIRWLAGMEKDERRVGSSVLVRPDRTYVMVGEEVRVTALVKDSSAQPAVEAAVTATVTGQPGREGEEVKLLPGEKAGIYQGTFRPRQGGRLAMTVSAADKAGKALGQDEIALTVAPQLPETERLARDGALLAGVASRRGGRYAELSALPDVVEEIIQRQQARLAPPAPPVPIRLYDFPLLFLGFVGLLTAEWILRRGWQLH